MAQRRRNAERKAELKARVRERERARAQLLGVRSTQPAGRGGRGTAPSASAALAKSGRRKPLTLEAMWEVRAD